MGGAQSLLNPQPSQIRPRLFWPALFASLAFALAAWAYPVYDPGAFTTHWLRNHVALKAVHSLALGQLGLLFLAVSAQALPVLFHLPQRRDGLTLWGQWLWGLGVLLLISFFAGWRHPAVLLLTLVALGLAWSLLHFQARAVAAAGSGRSLAWSGLRPAFPYLGLTALLGGAMAWGLIGPLLPQEPLANLQLHVHLGLWGFAAMAIFGLLPKLLRLFQASTSYATWPLKSCYLLVHAGLALLLLRWLGLGPSGLAPFAGGLFLLAAVLFNLQLLLLLRAAKSLRFDSSLTLQLAGALCLLVAAYLDARLLSDHGDWRDAAVALTLALPGFVGLTLLGTLQRISGVLAWFQRFYEASRTLAVPTAWALVHPGLAWSVLPLQLGAVLALAWGLKTSDTAWIRGAGISGCAAQLASIALAWRALTWGKAQPFPDGINPFEEWAKEVK